jgi:hypothetical protein
VQHLENLAMRQRAGLPPFHDDGDGSGARAQMAEIVRSATGARWSLAQALQQLYDEYTLPDVPPGSFPWLPKDGLHGPLVHSDAYLAGRLRAQRQWFVRKARQCRFEYFLIMGMTAAVNAGTALWGMAVGTHLWVVAAATTVNLMLYNLLDFWNSVPLWRQYRQSARELERIEEAYLHRERPFDCLDESKRLQRLVEHVENTLASEFQRWFALFRVRPPDPSPGTGAGYEPRPIDTGAVQLPAELNDLKELLAKNTHDVWAVQRLEEGWRYGHQRDEVRKENPCLVPYERLPESEKEYDRSTAMEALKVIHALGYRVAKVWP